VRGAAAGIDGRSVVDISAMLHSALAVINSRITEEARTAERALQPLNARSIVLSVLLGSHPPTMPVGALVEFTSLFGIAPGTTRTALSRMVAAGELTTDDGRYRLGERLLHRQAEQDTGRAAPPADWDGAWWFVVVTAERRPLVERRQFRSRMVGARLGELRPDTWMRPGNVEIPTGLPDAIVARSVLVDGDDGDLAATLWDLDELTRRTDELLDDLDGVDAVLDRGDANRLADAFVHLAVVQRFLRTEPQLPDELHRSEGAALRERYATVVDRYRSQLADFLRHHRRAD